MNLRFLVVFLAATHLSARAQEGGSPRILPRQSNPAASPTSVSNWPQRIARTDAGSQNDAWAAPAFDDREWNVMKLPVHWEGAGLPDYDGIVWFRRAINLPTVPQAGEAILELGAIDDMDVTWVNGTRVGGYEQPGAHFTPRRYKVPVDILKAGRNVIAVRVMDHGYGGGLAQTHGRMQFAVGDQIIPLTGAWRYRPGAALSQLLAPPGPRPHPGLPAEPFAGKFVLRPHDVIALAGGTNLVKQMEAGYLEEILTRSTPAPVYFRDIAWQADSVYRQQRPRNFGTHLDLLKRINATVIVASYGQMEALDGASRLPEFLAAYEKLLDEFTRQTPRIVLIGPHRFAAADTPHLPDLSAHNGDVAAYSEGIRQLARRRGLLFVDTSSLDDPGLTANGVHFNDLGQRAWAHLVGESLTGKPGLGSGAGQGNLLTAIQRKNTLWRQHWRPTNWSFLYGNRQHVPSSKDHRPGEPRWFPKEVNDIIPLILQAEDEIQQLKEETR